MNTNVTQHDSYKTSGASPTGAKEQYDLPALKKRVGLSPFSKRIKIDASQNAVRVGMQ
jgi:hypothetical protein